MASDGSIKPLAVFAAGAVAGLAVAGVVVLVQQSQASASQPASTSSHVTKHDHKEETAPQSASQPAAAPADSPERPDDAPESCPGVSSDQAGKADGCSGCPNQSLCASGEARKPDPAVGTVQAKLAGVKRKILVLSGKGGVGKSTVSAQISFGIAARNLDVGLLDVDICGPSVPRMLGLLGRDVHQSADGWQPVYVDEHLAVMSIGFMLPNQDDAIIWRGPRKNGLIKQFLTDVTWGNLEALVIDTPPGTSDEHLSVVTYLQDAQMDGAVIVTTPQEVALMDVRKEINFCRKVNLPIIGVVENMSGFCCPKCNHTEQVFAPTTGGAEAMCKDMDVKFLGRIPLDPQVVAAGDGGQSMTALHPSGAVAKCVDEVISAIFEQTDRKA